MSTVQMIGVTLTAVLVGVASGVLITRLRVDRQTRRDQGRVRRIDAYARWLAAWRIASRAALTFVAAYRRQTTVNARGTELPHSCREEVHRAQSEWYDARKTLDRAEAYLLVWSDDPEIEVRLAAFCQATSRLMHTALGGNQEAFHRLAEHLRKRERLATRWVRTSLAQKPAATPGVSDLIERLAVSLQDILARVRRS